MKLEDLSRTSRGSPQVDASNSFKGFLLLGCFLALDGLTSTFQEKLFKDQFVWAPVKGSGRNSKKGSYKEFRLMGLFEGLGSKVSGRGIVCSFSTCACAREREGERETWETEEVVT